MTLTDQATSYVAVKRATGLSFIVQERLLVNFAVHAEAQGDRFISVATVLGWACGATINLRLARQSG